MKRKGHCCSWLASSQEIAPLKQKKKKEQKNPGHESTTAWRREEREVHTMPLSTMSAVSANLCNEGICQMFVENDLIRSSFTGDGKTAERYMALAAAAGTGELTGRKCKTWTHGNKSNLGVLICLGCKTSLAPCRT